MTEERKNILIKLENFVGLSILSLSDTQFCKPLFDWIHPQITWSQFRQFLLERIDEFEHPILRFLFQRIKYFYEDLLHLGESFMGWINLPRTWNQFFSLIGLLLWKICCSTICDLTIIILFVSYCELKEKVYFLKETFLFRDLGYLFLFIYFQLPLLVESGPNIGIFLFVVLAVANLGMTTKEQMEEIFTLSITTLALIYLYLLGLWLFPLISFQLGAFILITHLDEKVFATNYLR